MSLTMYGKTRSAAVAGQIFQAVPLGSLVWEEGSSPGRGRRALWPPQEGWATLIRLDPSFPRNHGRRLTPGTCGVGWGGSPAPQGRTQTK